MPERTNTDRADAGGVATTIYAYFTKQDLDAEGADLVTDVIADILHYAHVIRGFDAKAIHRVALDHFEEETDA